uniref:Lipocln_cytosolic_FA-bd_dom domain-containing protein n=1 Tax=Macrostomum lignano TaxID=282301 RepID=A0A1I8H4Y4_9PLAT
MAENVALFGKWESYRSENTKAVMEKAGAPWLAQKMSDKANPTMTIERIDDKRIRIATKGSEQDCIAEWEDGRLVIYIAKPGSDPKSGDTKQIREILDNGEMLMTMQSGDVKGQRWFKKH